MHDLTQSLQLPSPHLLTACTPLVSTPQWQQHRPAPLAFFSISWQSLTWDSIHRRVKVWLCALRRWWPDKGMSRTSTGGPGCDLVGSSKVGGQCSGCLPENRRQPLNCCKF